MNSGETVCYPVTSLMNSELLLQTCYPPGYGCGNLLYNLEAAGVENLCHPLTRQTSRGIVGKGHSSVVLAAIVNGGIRAVKVRRRDSKRGSLIEEGRVLEIASRGGVAPKPYYYNDDVIVMDYISGPHLEEAIWDNPLHAVSESMKAARILDSLGIQHLELRRPWRHIRLTHPRGRAIILDYESVSKGCGNVVKLVTGILTAFPGGLVFLRGHRGLFKSYYMECSRGVYEEIHRVVLGFIARRLQ